MRGVALVLLVALVLGGLIACTASVGVSTGGGWGRVEAVEVKGQPVTCFVVVDTLGSARSVDCLTNKDLAP